MVYKEVFLVAVVAAVLAVARKTPPAEEWSPGPTVLHDYKADKDVNEQNQIELRGKAEKKALKQIMKMLGVLDGKADSLEDVNSNQNTKLDLIIEKLGNLSKNQGCPSNMLSIPGSNACFKLIQRNVTWNAAWAQCASEGLVLARPEDSIATVALRTKLVEIYGAGGNWWPWVSARGNGSGWSWRDDAAGSGSSSSGVARAMVWPGHRDRDSTSYCLALAVTEWDMSNHPTAPYASHGCTHSNYVLCQEVMD